MKRILSFVLALCLVVGLLPAVAIPRANADVTSAQVFLFGAYRDIDLDDTTADIPEALYWVNGGGTAAPVAATAEDNWNYALEIIEDVPTVTLRNAEYKYNANFFYYKAGGNVKLRYEGTNNVYVSYSSGETRYFLKNSSSSGTQYIEGAEDAVLTVTGGDDSEAMVSIVKKAYLTISGGTLNIEKTNAGGTSSVVNAQYAKTTIKNCNLTVKNSVSTVANQRPVVTMGYSDGGTVTFDNADIHIEGYGIMGLLAGVWDVNNGKPIYAAAITVSGNSAVKVVNTYSNDNTYSGRGIHAAKVIMNSGTLEAEGLNQALYSTKVSGPVMTSYDGDWEMYIAKNGQPVSEYAASTYIKVGPASGECTHEETTLAEEITKAATCGEAGSKKITVTCADCGEVISETTSVISATNDHNYDTTTGICSGCGDVEIPIEGPTWPEDVVFATAEQMVNVVLEKKASAGGSITAHPGGRITYKLLVTNNNEEAINVHIEDMIPKGTVLVSGCDTSSGRALYWVEKDIAPGETRIITYNVSPDYTVNEVRASETEIILTNTEAKVMDVTVSAPAKDIYVLETFNDADIRRMEMAIDALITANLTAYNSSKQQMNGIALASMMYSVGFSTGLGMPVDLDEILTLIYEKAGDNVSGGTGGSGEEDAVKATNLLDRVVPSLYGGTKIDAAKDSLFRGARAAEVTIEDLITGDLIIVSKDDETKLYIVDGAKLVELAKTAVTTKIDPATVLPGLTASDKYVVLRPSVNLATSYSLDSDEYYNDADKAEYTELEKALIATAEAYLLRGDRTQYDDLYIGKHLRLESLIKQPEDYTVDQYGYLDCSHFTYDLHWATYGYAAKATNTSGSTVSYSTCANMLSCIERGWDPETLTGTNKSAVYFYRPTGSETDAEKAEIYQEFVSLLRPGDIITYRYAGDEAGHAMLYVGRGLIIHCTGSGYKTDNKTDTHEAGIRFMNVDDLFDKTVNERRYMFSHARFGIVRPQNLTNAQITENTANRTANLQGIVAEKISSTAMGKTVGCGDTVTYTFYVNNTNPEERTITITDVLSQYVTFVSATDDAVVEGSNISWSITVPADTRISVSYTVKVNAGVAAYTAIDGSKAKINGVTHKCIDTYVANTLSTAQQQKLLEAVETVKNMDTTGLTSVQRANLIYKTAFGVDNIFGESVTTWKDLLNGNGVDNVGIFNDTSAYSDATYMSAMDSNTSLPSLMLAPGMYGGNRLYTSTKSGETFMRYTNVGDKSLRSRYYWEKDLVVGDLYLSRGTSAETLYIYVGDNTLLFLGESGTLFGETTVTSKFQYAASNVWYYQAVLRPSMVLDLPCEHEWTEATCFDPKTCTRCGETEGEALGHKWTDDQDTLCDNGCGTIREIEVEADPDIELKKTSSHRAAHTVSPGKTIEFTLEITNKSDSEKGVIVTDQIPKLAEFVSGCEDVSDNKLRWTFTLGAGETKTVTYTLKAKDDEAYLGMPFDGVATANGVKAACYNIYVERGLGNVDQRLMETAIDAFRQYTNLEGVTLLRMIWYVAISKSVSYNDTNGKVMTPAQILNYIYTGEGSFGGTTGSGEEAASAAVDFVKAVIPTLFGGKGVTAEQITKLHGEMAAAIEKADLSAGDAFFVQETEDDTTGKLYIYNGKRLFELGKGVIEVDTDKILKEIPNAYRYAGLRISYVIANRKDFSEDRVDTLTDVQQAIVSIAEALLLRGDRAQYDAGGMMAPDKRYEYGDNTPEDYTSDFWKYSNCANLTFDSYYFGLGLDTKSNWYTSQIIASAKSQKIFYYEPTGSETEEEKQTQYDKFYAALQPGDTIVIRRQNDSGHAMLYIGNGIVIHSTGGSYLDADHSGTGAGKEQYEATVRYLNAYDYFDAKCDNGGAYSYYVWGGQVTKIGIYRPHKNFTGEIPQETLNRMTNLKDIAVEKVASKASGQTVNVGEALTYTFKLLNAGDVDKTLDITDVIPAGTTLIAAPGATVEGENLSWQVTIPAGEKLEISYTVKVGANVPNNELTNASAKVGGVSVRSSKLFVKRTLNETEQQKIIDAVSSLSGTTLKNLELANEIYKLAFGVEDIFAHTELSTFHSQMFTKLDSGKYDIIDNQYGAMAAPGLYGGRNFNCDDEGAYGQITRLAREENLIVGDILFGRTSSSNAVYIYLGNGLCWSLSTKAADTVGLQTRLERFVGYRNYWVVLRPSMVLELDAACEHTNTTTTEELLAAATCTEPGSKKVTVTCECGEIISEEIIEIDALEHEWVIVEGKDATCTEPGCTEGEKCDRCGEVSIEQETIEANGEHAYDSDNDAVCNNCGFVRQMVDRFDFVNYRVVFSDSDTTHKNLRAVVYKLGDATVEDPSDENALKAIDANAQTYWGASHINKILLTDAGNYVVLLKYNIGTGAAIKVPMVLSVNADPKLIIDKNNKITVVESNGANINHRAVVYYLGDQTVEDIYDEAALTAIDAEPETVWKLNYINRLALTKGGNYVLHLCYNEGISAKLTVAQAFTVESIPSLSVDINNKVVVTEENAENRNHRAVVYYLGENTVEDPYDESEVKAAALTTSKTYWGLDAINKVELKDGGNYVVHLYYNVGTSEKRTLALDLTLNERPALSVSADGKLSVTYTDPEINNPRAYIYNVGDAEIADIYDEAALKAIATPTQVWGLSSILKKQLTPGTYVVHFYYSIGTSAKKTVALKVTI